MLSCQHGTEPVVIVPSALQMNPNTVPPDPFGAGSPAYAELRKVSDAALALQWNGMLQDFAPWLEEQTTAMERALALLKALRVGPQDVYAVANGRIAMAYDRIALALTHASELADTAGLDSDWQDQEGRIWEQASAFWGRCVRGCDMAGTQVDAWDLHCRNGFARSQAQLALWSKAKSPRQPE